MPLKRLEIISTNTDIKQTPRGAAFRRTDGTYIIGRLIEQPPKSTPIVSTETRRGFRHYGMSGSMIKGRARVIRETRTQPAPRNSAEGLSVPKAWAGSYATWESQIATAWSRPPERKSIQDLGAIPYTAKDFGSWEMVVREQLIK